MELLLEAWPNLVGEIDEGPVSLHDALSDAIVLLDVLFNA